MNKKHINPEIQREEENKKDIYDDDFPMTLFPGAYLGGVASSTESTGLIQVIPPSEAVMDVFDDVYSYRQSKPIAKNKKD